MKSITWSRKTVTAFSLIFAVLALSSGVYFWRVKADSAVLPGGVKVQLTDIQGQPVKTAVMLEILVYGQVRVCQSVRLAFAKISQCGNQDRAYTRYAATDENGLYTIPSNIGKPLTDTELRDTLQKVVYTSGQNLASDDVSDIIDAMKNIQVDNNPTFFMQAMQVIGSAYAAKFAGDIVKWTAGQLKSPTKKTNATTTPSTSTTPSSSTTTPSTSTTPSTTPTTTPTTTPSTTTAPTQDMANGSLKEILGPYAGTPTATDNWDVTKPYLTLENSPSALPAIPADATPSDISKLAQTATDKAGVNIEMGKAQIAQLDIDTAKIAGQTVLNTIISSGYGQRIPDLALHVVIQNRTQDWNNQTLLPQEWQTLNKGTDYADWYSKNMSTTDPATIDMMNRIAMIGISAAGTVPGLSDKVITALASKNIPVQAATTGLGPNEGPFQSGAKLANTGNNIWQAFKSGQDAAANITVANALDNATKIAANPTDALTNAPKTAALANTNLDTEAVKKSSNKKRNAVSGFISNIFSTLVSGSLQAGKILIPDPVSLGIALVYQAIGPRYEVEEKNFVPANAIVSTLSERFDSGRIRVDFQAGDNKTTSTSGNTTGVLQYFNLNQPTSASKNLQVVFRDEAVYNNSATSFLVKAFSTTTDSLSRNYMTNILGNYKDYLLETALRGSTDADANAALNTSIGKIGNLVCPAITAAN